MNNPSFKATESSLSWREEKATKAMKKWGYTDEQIALAIRETQLNTCPAGSVDAKDRNGKF